MMSSFRPAGLSDDDTDSDDYGFYEKPADRYYVPPLPNLRKKIENNLQDAILNGNLKEVEKIVICELKNNVNSKLESGWTLLLHACFHAQEKIVQFLLHRGADPNLHAEDSVTPMMAVCSNSGAYEETILKIVENLLEVGCLINIGDKYGQTPLMRAISSGRVSVVKKLLEYDANIEMRDQQGWTAVFWAAHHNQPVILEMLIEKNARLMEVDKVGRTPIEIAQSHDYNHLVDMISDKCNLHTKASEVDVKPYLDNQLRTWHDFYPGLNKDEKLKYLSEIPHLLYGMGCDRLVPIIMGSGIDLRTFLLLQEEDMIQLGVDLPYERQRLRVGLRNFHTRAWKLNAVAGLYARKNEDYSVLDCLSALGTHLLQVYILEATLEYTYREYVKVQNQIKFEPSDSPIVLKMKLAAKNLLAHISSIRDEIHNIKKALIKISRRNPPPADLIKEKSVHEIAVSYFSQAVLVCSLGAFCYHGGKFISSLFKK